VSDKEELAITLSDLLPEWLAKYLRNMTRENDPLRVASKLCAMNAPWFAGALLSAYIMSGTSSEVKLEVVPSDKLVRSCFMVEEKTDSGAKLYAVFKFLNDDGQEETSCIVIETIEDMVRARPCTNREIAKFVHGEGEAIAIPITA